MALSKLLRLSAPGALLLAAAVTAGVTGIAQAADRSPGSPHRFAMMQGLDKVTGRISSFELELDQPKRFGSLELLLRACWQTPPEEPPEASAFLEVDEIDPDSPRQRLFTGWMFASSPAISPLEHGVYDVWVMECRERLN